MKSTLGPILIVAALVIAMLGGALWFASTKSVEVFTDDANIDLALTDAKPRDILWQPPLPVDEHALPADAIGGSFSTDGARFAFAAPGPSGDLDLFESVRTATGWSEPRRLMIASSTDHDTTPAYGPDSSLWFASDRAGGAGGAEGGGGFDLWIASSSDTGWNTPEPAQLLHPAIKATSADEFSPSLAPNSDLLCFVRRADHTSPGDLVLIDLHSQQHLTTIEQGLNTEANETSPAFSPAGDFLYFASDRQGGAGGLDLYRSRITSDTPGVPWWLGQEVNSEADELDPSLDLAGFRLRFRRAGQGGIHASDSERSHEYHQTTAREVYATVRTSWSSFSIASDLLKVLPWLLLALALVLLFAGLRRIVHSGEWQQRFSTLGLMARCVLASIAIHAMLAVLLGLWDIHPGLPEGDGDQSTRVALTTHRATQAAASQLLAPATNEHQAITESVRAEPTPPPSASTIEHTATTPPASQVPTPRQQIAASTASPAASTPATRAPSLSEPEVIAFEPAPSLPTLRTAAQGERSSRQQTLTNNTKRPSTTPNAPATSQRRSTHAPTAASAAPSPLAFDLPPSEAATPSPSAPTPAAHIAIPDLAALTPGLLDAPAMPTGERIAHEPAVDDRAESKTSRHADLGEPSTHAPIALELAKPTRINTARSARATKAPLPTNTPPADLPTANAPTPLATNDALTRHLAPPLPTPVLPVARVITGVVLDDATSKPIADADVQLDGDRQRSRTVTTDEQGRFQLTPAKLPEFAALTASAPGYLTKAVNIAEADVGDGIFVEFRLNTMSRSIIALDDAPDVHHLGNDEFSGRINSQFQVSAEGIRYRRTFTLAHDQVPPMVDLAAIRILVRGVQNPNLIFVNGHKLPTRLDTSPSDGSFGEFIAVVPAELLREGENTFEIEAVKRQNTDIDDFEFVNPQLFLRRSKLGAKPDTKPKRTTRPQGHL